MRDYLKILRENAGYSQQYVASILGMTRQCYNFIEHGKRQKNINLSLLRRLSSLYSVSISELLELEIEFENARE